MKKDPGCPGSFFTAPEGFFYCSSGTETVVMAMPAMAQMATTATIIFFMNGSSFRPCNAHGSYLSLTV